LSHRVGIDVGGTFTDFLLVRSDGTFGAYKTLTTSEDQSIGIMEGLDHFARRDGDSLRGFLAGTEMILHGTTATTNCVLTGSGAVTGLLTTRGFRDAFEMRRGVKERIYDNKYPAPFQIVPRYRRLPVGERTRHDGTVVVAVEHSDVSDACEALRAEGIQAVAICFLNGYANGTNEVACKSLVESELPGVYVSASHEVLPKIGFYDRLSTTVLNAYTGPILARYLASLTDRLSAAGFSGALLIMQSSGGVVSARSAIEIPAGSVESGPAGGAVAGARYAAVQGFSKAVTFDMGGTSLDIARIIDGRPANVQTSDFNRYRLALPMVDVISIGAGGGSIARVAGGLLQVGPQSAGATPGPACYRRGGTDPTVTDADLVLGYISPGGLLGGRVPLDIGAARDALERDIARPLDLSVEDAAVAVFDVVNVNMASAVKRVLHERGDDPGEFALVVAGGAGPLHAASVAKELGIAVVIVPRDASIFSAAGVLLSDLRHDFVQTAFAVLPEVDASKLADVFVSMIDAGREVLGSEGIPPEQQSFEFSLDMRYERQIYEIQVPVSWEVVQRADLANLAERFHSLHDESYGYELRDAKIELLNARVAAVGRTRPFWFPEQRAIAMPRATGRRRVSLPGLYRWSEVVIYDSESFGVGTRCVGPAIIEGASTSVLIPDGWEVESERYGNYVLQCRIEGADSSLTPRIS